jgi:predicted nucleic acid-binding protein
MLLFLSAPSCFPKRARACRKACLPGQIRSASLRTELERLGRPFTAPLPEIGSVCRDPNDDHVIATALALNADVIVTGDKDLLALSRYRSIRILTARMPGWGG